jgi:hypothetical protein
MGLRSGRQGGQLLDCLGLVAADPIRRLSFPKRVAVRGLRLDGWDVVVDRLWGRRGVQAACVFSSVRWCNRACSLQLAACFPTSILLGLGTSKLQMGEGEPAGDRMASRGPSQRQMPIRGGLGLIV